MPAFSKLSLPAALTTAMVVASLTAQPAAHTPHRAVHIPHIALSETAAWVQPGPKPASYVRSDPRPVPPTTTTTVYVGPCRGGSPQHPYPTGCTVGIHPVAPQRPVEATKPAEGPVVAGGGSAGLSGDPNALSVDTPAWQCVIRHESGGDPTAINAESGDSGLFQFAVSTWLSNGGGKYASQARYATPAEQDAIALATYRADGWSPWAADYGVCGLG